MREVTGAFLSQGVHQPVQHLRPPFEVGQALVERGACVVLCVVQQGEDVMNAARLALRS